MNNQLDEREKINKALEARLRFEGLLSDLSARFVRVSADRLDGEIENALKAVLEFFQVDRCGLLLTLPDRSALQVTYARYANDQVMSVPVGTIVSRTRFPWAFEQLVEKRQIVAFSSTDDLPPEAQVDRQSWMAQGTRSTLLIPIYTGGSVVYTIVINAMKNEQVWPEEFIPRLRLLGEILANALERRTGEQALKKEEAKYRLIFDGALEGLFESSPEGKVLTANIALSRMLGYDSPEELTSTIRNVGKQIWVDEQERADYVERLEKQGVILKHECRFRRRDGSEIWVSLSTRLATGPEGQAIYSGFVEDITERRQAADALRERLRFEKLISDLSARFVNIPPEQVDSEIENGLRQILELFQVDRCALLRLQPARSTYQITHAASSDHVPPVTAGGELPSSLYPWAYEKLAEKQEVVSVSRLDDPAPRGCRRQADMHRKGYSILSEHSHPDRRGYRRHLCQFRKKRAGLAGSILSPAATAGRDLCQCPGAQEEPVGTGGTAQVRDGPGRDLGTLCQPACRPAGQRDHGCRAPHLREFRDRWCGTLAVVERGPGIFSCSPTFTARWKHRFPRGWTHPSTFPGTNSSCWPGTLSPFPLWRNCRRKPAATRTPSGISGSSPM